MYHSEFGRRLEGESHAKLLLSPSASSSLLAAQKGEHGSGGKADRSGRGSELRNGSVLLKPAIFDDDEDGSFGLIDSSRHAADESASFGQRLKKSRSVTSKGERDSIRRQKNGVHGDR